MSKYILRLDDASDYMDLDQWNRMATLLNEYNIKPMIGIIPQNRDESLVNAYSRNPDFWAWVKLRMNDGWSIAMHGFEHCFVTQNGGIHPVNLYSEFAGLSYEEQCEKIKRGYSILEEHGIYPNIFFAPAHTFDNNTLRAIKNWTPIRIISDTIAYDVYKDGEFFFIPQQSGKARSLPFPLVTFCYHPNTMTDRSFEELQGFLARYASRFISVDKRILKNRKMNFLDRILRKLYFIRR